MLYSAVSIAWPIADYTLTRFANLMMQRDCFSLDVLRAAIYRKVPYTPNRVSICTEIKNVFVFRSLYYLNA